MRTILIMLLIISNFYSHSQMNCLIYPEESGERKACLLSYKAIEYKQGSKESQLLFDSAIAVGPKFPWAYYEKSVPYFKRGFLIEGLQILNKAIALDSVGYLWYRASWYFDYKNYELCIKDLETYYALPNSYQQSTPGGEKDMRIILGLAYAKTGNYKKGIETIESCIKSYKKEYEIGFADYHSLGILYLHNEQLDKAIEAFQKQLSIYENFADTYYFLGLAYKKKGMIEESSIQFNTALTKFSMVDNYRNPNAGFRVYLSDIEEELEKL